MRVFGYALVLGLLASIARAQQFGPWNVIGPFEYPVGSPDIDVELPLETEFSLSTIAHSGPDLKATIRHKNGPKLGWKPVPETNAKSALDVGEIDLSQLLAQPGKDQATRHAAAFLYRRIDAPAAVEVPIMLGCSGAVRVWLDGKPILSREGFRHFRFHQDRLTLVLGKGTHHLLLKSAVLDEWTWKLRLGDYQAPTGAEIEDGVRRAVAFLLDQQLPDGTWGDQAGHGAGHSAFVLFALLHAGVDPDHVTVRTALAAMRERGVRSTYGAATTLLALGELERGSQEPLFGRALEYLLENQRADGLWDYGNPKDGWTRPPDLSCTMFASMALRAAAQAGRSIPTEVLAKLASGVMGLQEQGALGTGRKKTTPTSAGFRYEEAAKDAYGSVTLAGLTAIGVVRALERGALDKSLLQRLDVSQSSALQWLERNQRWDVNPMHPDPNANYFFHLWGIERIGALLSVKQIGGVEWYGMGSGALLDRQWPEGPFFQYWGGEDVVGTTLGLLFLSRATLPRTRGVESQSFAHVATNDGDLGLTADGNGPVTIRLKALSAEVLAKLGQRELDITDIEFRAARFAQDREWQVLARLPAAKVKAEGVTQFSLEQRFGEAGAWWVRVRIHLKTDESVPLEQRLPDTLKSGPVLVFAQDEKPAERLDFIERRGKNLLRGKQVKVETSSAETDRPGSLVLDERFETGWRCLSEDENPWIRLTLDTALTFDRIVLTQAESRAGSLKTPEVKRVAVLLDGIACAETEMQLDPVRATVLVLPGPKEARTVEVRILDRKPFTNRAREAGFSEILLLNRP